MLLTHILMQVIPQKSGISYADLSNDLCPVSHVSVFFVI